MSFRTIVGIALLACASSWPVASALADELSEVNRLHHAGQSADALKRADTFLATKPKDAQMRFLKAILLTDLRRRDEAITLLVQLTNDYPELAEPFNNLAALYAVAGDYAKARAALEDAVRANPDYAIARENLGDVYAMLASQSYSQALRLEPTSATLPAKISVVLQLGKPNAKARAASPAASAP